MKSLMLNAEQARAKAQNDLVIFHEVRDLEEAILTATAAGEYKVAISNTTMTDTDIGIDVARQYHKVWIGATDDIGKQRQMATVVQYFSDLGYSVERRTNTATSDTFTWYIYW